MGMSPFRLHFGRVYAAYGEFFVLSFFWGWAVDGDMPDRFDVIGAALRLAGVLIIGPGEIGAVPLPSAASVEMLV